MRWSVAPTTFGREVDVVVILDDDGKIVSG